MVIISEIIKALSTKNPHGSPARLAFFNFLSAACHPQDSFSDETLDLFYAYCGEYAHWQQHKDELSQEIRNVLKTLSRDFNVNLFNENYRHLDQVQIIEIQRQDDFVDALQAHLHSQFSKDEQFRLIVDNKKINAIILNKDLSLEVRRYDRKFKIENGHLSPLRQDLTLRYTENLELDPLYQQRLEVAPYVHLYFESLEGRTSGVVLRGYLCQKHQEIKQESLEKYGKILMSLKRIEQYFINRASDPFYQSLTKKIEKTLSLLRVRDPEAMSQATLVLAEGQAYLESVFIDDKLLSLLVRELELTLSQLGPITQKDVHSWHSHASINL